MTPDSLNLVQKPELTIKIDSKTLCNGCKAISTNAIAIDLKKYGRRDLVNTSSRFLVAQSADWTRAGRGCARGLCNGLISKLN